MMAYTCNPSTAEAGSEVKASLVHTAKPCLKKKKGGTLLLYPSGFLKQLTRPRRKDGKGRLVDGSGLRQGFQDSLVLILATYFGG